MADHMPTLMFVLALFSLISTALGIYVKLSMAAELQRTINELKDYMERTYVRENVCRERHARAHGRGHPRLEQPEGA
ncbi:MAG TPA: hypothetical protein VFA33_07465 [Bryobacteraceae bacterium]|nr:hypothetical protein [Bryobacteraceae bacterium]